MEDEVLTESPVAEGFAAAPRGCEADGETVTLSRKEYERLWNVDWYSPLVFDPEELELQLIEKGLYCTDRLTLEKVAHAVAYSGNMSDTWAVELGEQAIKILARLDLLRPLWDGAEDQIRPTMEKGE